MDPLTGTAFLLILLGIVFMAALRAWWLEQDTTPLLTEIDRDPLEEMEWWSDIRLSHEEERSA
ncbi:MAG: hypothetical protein M3355_11860 [Actinomycetota bacterium]|nr:hypothetical protein [Actinomycetota bacterium]